MRKDASQNGQDETKVQRKFALVMRCRRLVRARLFVEFYVRCDSDVACADCFYDLACRFGDYGAA